MFDHTLYDRLRKSVPYCEEAFPEVYDKVCKAAREQSIVVSGRRHMKIK